METKADSVIYWRGVMAGFAVVVMMAAASLWASAKLPAGQYPVHWDINGKADQFGSKSLALWLNPAIGAAVALLFAVLPLVEPRRNHLKQSMKGYMSICISVLLLLLGVHVAMLAVAFGFKVNMLKVIAVLLGLLFCVIGNYLGKLRSNFFAGIRTPWTLSSELSWNKTHRLSGKLFFGAGIALVITGIVGSPQLIIAVILVFIALMIPATFGYSYIVWKNDPARSHGNGGTA